MKSGGNFSGDNTHNNVQKTERRQLYAQWFLKNCPEMFFMFDEQMCLVDCSEACLPLLRSGEKSGLKNLPLKEIFSAELEEGWVKRIYQQNIDCFLSLSHSHFEDTIAFRNKAHMYAHISISPILDEAGQVRGTIMSISDTTNLVENKLSAEEAARSKGSFLANMSHEIRTPMNAVKGLSELLALTELNSLQRNYVKNIINSANSLLAIINDVLDFSKIDANKIEFIEGPYDLAGLITGVCNVISMRADDKNLALFIDASPNLPATLHGDDVRIKQVITNLLSNAVKYTNEGYVRLIVRMEECNGATWLNCAVEDSGIGIHEEDIPILFDAFSRADLLSNRNISGTGLGLAISRQLVVAMGGDIEVKSEHGQGSVFSFRIPQKIVEPRPIAQVTEPESRRALLLGKGEHLRHLTGMLQELEVAYTHIESQQALSELDFGSYTHCISDGSFPERMLRLASGQMPQALFAALKNMRYAMSVSDYQDVILYLPVFISELSQFLNKSERDIPGATIAEPSGDEITLRDVNVLVVDDNEINLVVSTEMLHSFSACVTCAQSGDEALDLCMNQKFDIIFMDHMMPGKDGILTTIELRSIPNPNQETPIIALTANVVNNMESIYLSSGMDDFIGKPIELADISRVLCKWLPQEKICRRSAALSPDTQGVKSELLTPEDIIAAFDNFGLYSSDVMREMNGDFAGYINRMEEAAKVLNDLVSRLKIEVTEKRWEDFANDCMELRGLLHGIGARDCAGRARKLALAGREGNVDYIYEDFFSLMGNMYMLDKKLEVIVPFARGDGGQDLPLGAAQFLYGCLEKMGVALLASNAVEAMTQLENAAAFSLDMELDMALKVIKVDLEKGDFEAAIEHHATIFRSYKQRVSSL